MHDKYLKSNHCQCLNVSSKIQNSIPVAQYKTYISLQLYLDDIVTLFQAMMDIIKVCVCGGGGWGGRGYGSIEHCKSSARLCYPYIRPLARGVSGCLLDTLLLIYM